MQEQIGDWNYKKYPSSNIQKISHDEPENLAKT